ncbi:MAG TPA: sensor histidine kinase [Vicinamibacterales bacterium]|nr:sensor histidine kinase [Vicinamibacterales bacterium]
MRSVAWRLVLMIATAAVLPLVIFGLVSIGTLRVGTREAVREGNLNVATRAAEQVALYIQHSVKALEALASELRGTHLEPWQRDRVIKNYLLDFAEFREITFFDLDRRPIATSRIGGPRLRPPAESPLGADVRVAAITIDDDLLPTTTISVPIVVGGLPVGWIVAEISLEELWRMIDRIRVGQEGRAALLSRDGRLVAHGDPDQKRYIASGDELPEHHFADQLRRGATVFFEEYARGGRTVLGTGAAVPRLGWAVVVEQPTAEAYAIARRLQHQLAVASVLALLATVIAGLLWGRSLVGRISALRHATVALAQGKLDARAPVTGHDEIRELAESFNAMADRLEELQELMRRQERQLTFARLTAGLYHDLSSPLMNMANHFRMFLGAQDDPAYRELTRRAIERELATLRHLVDDLRSVTKPRPLERAPVELVQAIRDTVDALRHRADEARLALQLEAPDGPIWITGHAPALARVWSNLIINAIQATPPQGSVTVTVRRDGNRARVTVADTGCGIAPERLATIFEDFVTTKEQGLGLGLSVARRIVEQHEGRIWAASQPGLGATFTIELPVVEAPAAAARAAERVGRAT